MQPLSLSPLSSLLTPPALSQFQTKMFKSKLQELCQQQKRALPKYTFIKDGDDHCPQFKASVVVGGVTFHAPSAANSSKQALNQVAQLAFLHFISEASDQKDENSEKASSKNVVQNKEELKYKSKLQELCQKQRWALPIYTCIRDGADHCPQFKASVVVCGVAFDSPAPCNSSKLAFNEVAQLAFLHFTSNQRSENADKKNLGKEDDNSKSTEDKSINNYLEEGMKNKLRKYAQRKNLRQPAYCTEKEGDCFKAKVCVGEDWFTSNELCATAEEAEKSAAATALLALLTDAFHEENDPRSYKTLLHKLASDEGFFPPVYKTMRSVESDSQSFSTTVEVEGEVFQGAAANSETLAELNAAKAAYTTFIERKLFEPRYGVFKLARRFDLCGISDTTQENPTYGSPSPLISDTIDENQETVYHSNCMSEVMSRAEMKSYLLCNRVKVFTRMPNMALPKGTVVLPICGDKWAVVTLEFLNEKAVV